MAKFRKIKAYKKKFISSNIRIRRKDRSFLSKFKNWFEKINIQLTKMVYLTPIKIAMVHHDQIKDLVERLGALRRYL